VSPTATPRPQIPCRNATTRTLRALTPCPAAGVEVGPKDIGLGGLTGNSGVRLRMEINTFGAAKSFRPMAGLIAHF